jgi:hypothetical protein
MGVESDQDRLNYLDPDLFGVEAVYTPKSTGVAGAPIVGIFDDEHVGYDPARFMGGPEYAQQMGAKFTSSGPQFHCRRLDLPDAGKFGSTVIFQGDEAVSLGIAGKTYRVQDKKPDGTGMIILILMEEE